MPLDPSPPPAPSGRLPWGFVLRAGFGAGTLGAALDVLPAVNAVLGQRLYTPCLLSEDGGLVTSSGGMSVWTSPIARAPALDAVFVVADDPLPAPAERLALRRFLRDRAAEGLTLGGLGSGALWLAEAGLLRGHRATAHWPHIAAMGEGYADTVVSHHCYEIDRGRLTAAGLAAATDLLVAWFGQRHGDRVVQELLPALGLERLRPPEERQREPASARAGAGSAKLAEAVALMEANLGEPLPTEDIARLVGVSRRQLERLFKQHLDALPSRWYTALRLERARRLLQQTPQSILQIGLSCGFASGPHFSNAYRACFGRTPREERGQRAAAWRSAPVLGAGPVEAASRAPAPDAPAPDAPSGAPAARAGSAVAVPSVSSSESPR